MRFAGEDVKEWHSGPSGCEAGGSASREGAVGCASSVAGARWVARLAVAPCPRCGAKVDIAQQASAALGRVTVWRLDTRQIYARCPGCHSFFKAFAYPLFNWVPLSRVITGLAILNVLVVILLLATSW